MKDPREWTFTCPLLSPLDSVSSLCEKARDLGVCTAEMRDKCLEEMKEDE